MEIIEAKERKREDHTAPTAPIDTAPTIPIELDSV